MRKSSQELIALLRYPTLITNWESDYGGEIMARKESGELRQEILQRLSADILDPARSRGESRVRIKASDLDQVLGRINRTHAICRALINVAALRSHRARLIDTDFTGKNPALSRWFLFEVLT